MKKRLLGILMVTLSVMLLSSCGKSISRNQPDVASSKKIGIILSSLNNPFFMAMKAGAEAKARELGYELIVLDSQNNIEKDQSNIESLIGKKVRLILLNPTDSDGMIQAIKSANKAEIPVITLDRTVTGGKIYSHISSDNVAGGKMAADFINRKLSGKGNIIELQGIIGTSASIDRSKGFRDQLKLYPGLMIIASQPAEFDRAKGLSVTEGLLQENPDVQAIFAANDEMALGSLQAVEETGKTMVIVGFDGTLDALAAVNEGKMAATVAQQPELIGSLGIETADRIIKGEKVEETILIPLKLMLAGEVK